MNDTIPLTRRPFGTVLRHEWLRTRAMVAAVFAVLAAVAVGATLIAMTGLPGLAQVGQTLSIVAAVAVVPVTQIGLAKEYWTSSYGQRGYLTQTLPVRGATLYAAKLAWCLICSVAAVLVAAALGAIAWIGVAVPSGQDPNVLTVVVPAIEEAAAVMPPWMLAAAAVLLTLTLLVWPVQYLFVASVGSETPLNRLGMGGPIVLFVALYVAMQVLMFVGVIAVPFGIGMTASSALGIVPFDFFASMTGGDVMPLGFVPVLLVATALCAWRTVHSWRRKVTLV